MPNQARPDWLTGGPAHSAPMDPAERLVYPERRPPTPRPRPSGQPAGRAHLRQRPPRAARILAEFQSHRPEFVRTRELQEVAQRYDESKTIVHPEFGRIDVDGRVLFTDNRAQTRVVLTARPGSESSGKLELLSVIGHQQLTA